MNFKAEVSKISEIETHFESDLTSYTTFRLKSFGDLVIVKSVASLQLLLKLANQFSRSYRMIGWGANQVLSTHESDLLIKLDLPFDLTTLDKESSLYDLPASLGLNHLTSHAVKFNLSGWEVFTGVPASLGGAIVMNAGTTLGEIGSLVESVEVMNSNGEIRREVITNDSFGYRKNYFLSVGDIILSARLIHKGIDPTISQKIKDYIQYRKKTQPLASKNCGCVFKNYDQHFKAGKFIDQSGLKGLSVGALSVSLLHANFMENKGQSDYADFLELTRLINQQMQLHWGIEFELEVKAV